MNKTQGIVGTDNQNKHLEKPNPVTRGGKMRYKLRIATQPDESISQLLPSTNNNEENFKLIRVKAEAVGFTEAHR